VTERIAESREEKNRSTDRQEENDRRVNPRRRNLWREVENVLEDV
jgi:hypothetical protein